MKISVDRDGIDLLLSAEHKVDDPVQRAMNSLLFGGCQGAGVFTNVNYPNGKESSEVLISASFGESAYVINRQTTDETYGLRIRRVDLSEVPNQLEVDILQVISDYESERTQPDN